MVGLTPDPIDVAALRRAVAHHSCGAVLLFEGTTRDTFEGRPVVELAYEAYEAMALAALEAIRGEVHERWPGARCAIVHRLGEVAVGQTSVVVAVAAAHRAEAYEASRHAIEALKARVPVWKQERYADGASWKANQERT